jgi:putative Mn2+ efflux pump MntP
MNFLFFFNSILMGIGLAMDAFSVSLANGLNEPCMRLRRVFLISGVFAVFQGIMPLTGWFLVHTAKEHFATFASLVPFIALLLLSFIGGKMLYEGIKYKECETCRAVGIGALLVQGVATSIDALSVGFTIADYTGFEAIVCGLVIAAVTFGICLGGILIGRRMGTKLSGKAGILGGCILIFIGLEIFITGII